MCVKIYNAKPDPIKILPINRFKKKLKVWLLEKMFYKIGDLFNNY